jgi:bacterioferritin-associated ferredoxin
MVLCVCRYVTEREVDAVVQSGARTVDAVGERCGAGTDCGMCRDAIEERLEGSCSSCPRARDCHPGHAAVASAAP